MNRFALAFALATCLAFSACAITSQTQIPAGQTFMVGGEQRAPVRVEGRNSGSVAVDILAQKDGKETLVRRVEPGALFSRTFAAGEQVRVRNVSSSQQAVVNLELTGDTANLSMRYDKRQP